MAKKRVPTQPTIQNNRVKQLTPIPGSFTQRHASWFGAASFYVSVFSLVATIVGLPQLQNLIAKASPETMGSTSEAVVLASKKATEPGTVEAKTQPAYTPGWDVASGGNYPAKIPYNDGNVGSPAYDTGTTYNYNYGSRKSPRVKGQPHGALRSDANLS